MDNSTILPPVGTYQSQHSKHQRDSPIHSFDEKLERVTPAFMMMLCDLANSLPGEMFGVLAAGRAPSADHVLGSIALGFQNNLCCMMMAATVFPALLRHGMQLMQVM